MNKSQYFFRTGVSIIVTIMLLVTISTANAQNKVGFKTAFNYSSFRGNPNLKAGYQLGIAGKKYIGDLGWFFQPEVNYSGYQSGFLIGTRDNGSIDYKTYNPVINFGLEFYPSNRSVFGARYDYGISDIDKSDFSAITFNFEVYLIFWIKN
jgi:hypothetical protein